MRKFFSPEQPIEISRDEFPIDGRKWNRSTPKICVFLFFLVPSFFAASLKEEVSSKNNERLRKSLKEFPEADTDKDGILTLVEARAFIAQRRFLAQRNQRQNPLLRREALQGLAAMRSR